MNVVGAVGQRRHQLAGRHPPLDSEVVAQQHPRQLAARGRARKVERRALRGLLLRLLLLRLLLLLLPLLGGISCGISGVRGAGARAAARPHQVRR